MSDGRTDLLVDFLRDWGPKLGITSYHATYLAKLMDELPVSTTTQAVGGARDATATPPNCPDHPETGAHCELSGSHTLHVGSGVTWTDQQAKDLLDPQKRLIYELQKTRQAIERVAAAIENHTSEQLHRVR